MWLPEFRIEAYFSRWEFTARYHLTASDVETLPMSELLALADDEDRRAWQELRLGYTETYGDPALREAIAATYQGVAAGDVLCFAGLEEGVFLAMHVLLGRDDHAVVVTPNYQSAESVPLSICEVTGVALDPDRDWALHLDAVREAVRPNTRVVYVNFPHNPTGALIDADDLRTLVAFCDGHGIHLICDEIHRGIERDPGRTLPQAADLSERALSLSGMAKAYGLPGLRIGWIACRDRQLLARLERAKHYTTICNAAPSEILARIALGARDHLLARSRGIVAANLPRFAALFAEFEEWFEFSPPDGGCVCFPRYRGPGDAETLCRELVEQAGVLLLPPSIFGSQLSATPSDRFRIGLGRRDPEPALDAFATWLRRRQLGS
jgi:aspartate/methionine/tyrosine aminotransferase